MEECPDLRITAEPVQLKIVPSPAELTVATEDVALRVTPAPVNLETSAEVVELTISPWGQDTLSRFVLNERPAGSVDGSNGSFTTAHDYQPGTTRLFLNGLRQAAPENYLEAGGDQLELSFAPEPGDVLIVDYIQF